jgi:hypothetical protein
LVLRRVARLVIDPLLIFAWRRPLERGTVIDFRDRDDAHRFGQTVTPAGVCHQVAVASRAEGLAHHRNLLAQVGLDHHGAWPESPHQLILRNDLAAPFDEQLSATDRTLWR